MSRFVRHFHSTGSRWLGAAFLATSLTGASQAGIVNKYTFNNNNVEDSVGGQNGTLVDRTGIATYSGGALDLRANNNLNSGRDFSLATTIGAYVNLPNGIFKNAAINSGVPGQVSLEMWLEVQENRNWAEAFFFGRSSGGEGPSNDQEISNNGDGQQYVAMIPRSDQNDFRATTRRATAPFEGQIVGGAPLPVNTRHHVVLTLNHLDDNGGLFPNGTATLYLNNSPTPAKAEIKPFLNEIDDINNWLGRSPWGGDPLLDGLIDEFRIYDNVLTPSEVATSFTTGPDPAPVPVLIVDRSTGAMTLKNNSQGGINIKGYTITSAAGALNTAGWTTIDTGTFDPDGTWSNTLSATSISETLVQPPAGDGGTIPGAPNAGRGIGTPFFKTPFQDIQFSYTLQTGGSVVGQVQYTGTAPARSDLNGDGAINRADWALFAPNTAKVLTGETIVGAYRKGDLDGDGDNDFKDFRLFKADYIAVNGMAAFAALGAVPEPASAGLAIVACCGLLGARRRRNA